MKKLLLPLAAAFLLAACATPQTNYFTLPDSTFQMPEHTRGKTETALRVVPAEPLNRGGLAYRSDASGSTTPATTFGRNRSIRPLPRDLPTNSTAWIPAAISSPPIKAKPHNRQPSTSKPSKAATWAARWLKATSAPTPAAADSARKPRSTATVTKPCWNRCRKASARPRHKFTAVKSARNLSDGLQTR